MIDVDKFVASLIKHYCEAYGIDRTSIRCWFDDALEEQGLEYKDGKIVKTQRRIAAEAKEAIFDNEDERIRKRIIDALHGDVLDMEETNKAIAWLEKQGEQKVPINDFKAKNWYVSEVDGKIHDMTYNPTDKDEPKFKVGDWIIRSAEGFKHNTYLITEVKDYYVCEELKGRRVTFTFNDVHNNFKLWDISDAKDGDVLVDKNYMGESPFIFKETKPSNIKTDVPNPLTVLGYCGIGGAGFTKSSGWGDTANCIYYPATKEQRDLLFKKMKESGYEWNPDTKKLKKVEQKPTWSEDDDENLNRVIGVIERREMTSIVEQYKDILHTYIYWLKSLKQRFGGK